MAAVVKEVAENDFNSFCASMDLDVDVSDMGEEDLEGFQKQKGTIVRGIMSGQVSIDDNGEPTVHLKIPVGEKKEVHFNEPTGATFLAIDKMAKEKDVSKMYAMISQMTETPAHVFGKMSQRDLKVCQAIAMVFLG